MKEDELAPAFDAARFIRALGRNGHNGLVGLAYHAHGDNWAELRLDWREELAGDAATGVLASGPIITMLDMASGTAIWLAAKSFRPTATIDLRVDYLRPAEPGRTLYGRAECYRITRSVAFVRGHAHQGDEGRLVAHAAGTFMFTDG